ncbi:MAG: ComF family protein [Ruminococcus sp.]|nr:ComF family protein [Ruminococcus sp.]
MVMPSLKEIREMVITAFFPARCPYCNKVIYRTECGCKDCLKKLPEYSYKRYAWGGYLCAAALPYENNYAKSVRRLKFGNRGDFAKPLAAQMVQAILEIHEGVAFDVVTAVPMHKTDKRRRGYNQAELLARECAAMLQLPYAELLEKYRRNKPQHETKGSDREKNVRGVFRLLNREETSGKRILLVDDIITTGYTLGECARILKQGKCADIGCAVVCTVVENRFE